MAQAGLEAASLTASAVNDHVKAVTEICTARAKALAQEAKDAAQAASDPLLAQLRAWRDAQGTRYASLVVAVAEARVAAWRGGIDVAADVAETKAIAGIKAWGRTLAAEATAAIQSAAVWSTFAERVARTLGNYAAQVTAAIDDHTDRLGTAGVTFADQTYSA